MDGLIEQMLDGLFRMAEKVTRAPYNLPQKGEATKKLAEKEEGKTSNYVRSAGVQECRQMRTINGRLLRPPSHSRASSPTRSLS